MTARGIADRRDTERGSGVFAREACAGGRRSLSNSPVHLNRQSRDEIGMQSLILSMYEVSARQVISTPP